MNQPETFYQDIDEMLWYQWDPLKLRDSAPRSVYRSYIPGIIKLKQEGATLEQIADVLLTIERGPMNLPGDPSRCKEMALQIHALSLPPIVILETPRLWLRGHLPVHIHLLFNQHPKDYLMQYFGFSEGAYQTYLKLHEKGLETYRISSIMFVMIEKESGMPIGEVGFHTWNRSHRRAELFYLLRDDQHKQRGYMKEALRPILEYGFNTMNLHRVEALVASWNTPSVKLINHFGFSFEGTMRQDYIVDGNLENSDGYSLMEEEWESWKTQQPEG